MKQPFIGITTTRREADERSKISCQENYIRSILTAGGIPLLIPLGLSLEQRTRIVEQLDGIMLTGGGDIHPRYFNGKSHSTVYGIIPDRDELEVSLVNLAMQHHKPLLGICRGCQVMNVALGGTLITDIPTQFNGSINHSTSDDNPWPTIAHSVNIVEKSRLAKIISEQQIEVNSRHHQAVEKVAPGTIVSAVSPDGLIEGIEAIDHPFCIGVQWHPEGMPSDPNAKELFAAFVEAARTMRESV